MDQPDFSTLRRRVLAGIEADLAREEAQAQALQAAVIPRLREALEAARQARHCTRAWLFGSFAWGRPTERSDVDVLVEGCSSPDGLAGELWRAIDRAVHVVTIERAPSSLVERVLSEGWPL